MRKEDGSVGLPVNEPDFTPVSVALDKLNDPRFALVNVAFVRSAVEPRMFPATSPHPEGNVGAEVATTAPDETLVNVAPERFVEVSVAPRNFTLVRFAPARTVCYKLVPEFILAPVRFALVSFAPFRFASPKFAYARFAPARFTSRISAFDKLMPVVRTTDAPMM